MNIQLTNLSVAQLQRAITIKGQIEALNAELARVLGASPASSPTPQTPVSAPALARKKKVMSPAARAKIAAAQKARWAARKGVPASKVPQVPAAKPVVTTKPKPKMSAAGRARIIAAQKLRWAKVKAAKPQAAKPVQKVVRNISPEARRKMAEAAKARWAKIKAAKKWPWCELQRAWLVSRPPRPGYFRRCLTVTKSW
jgi:hypothetical protein